MDFVNSVEFIPYWPILENSSCLKILLVTLTFGWVFHQSVHLFPVIFFMWFNSKLNDMWILFPDCFLTSFSSQSKNKLSDCNFNKRSDTQQKFVYFEISRIDLTVSLLSLVTEKSWYSWTFTKIKTVNEANRVNRILISA